MGNLAQTWLQYAADAIRGGCGAACQSGTTAGQIWATAGRNLWNVASELGMMGQQDYITAIRAMTIAGTRHLLTLHAAGDASVPTALPAMLAALTTLQGQGSTLPASSPNALDTTAAPSVFVTPQISSADPGAINAARVLTNFYLAIPAGQLQAAITAAMQSAAPPPG